MSIDTGNDQLVAAQGDNVLVMLPKQRMTRDEAFRHAAYLVATAKVLPGETTFNEVLRAVQNT